ncbi:MAG: phage baseplate assembly protein V [Oscillospiraceae bacterium]|nr:phage baseplate assembly protein V [Oscillospiraceae bacterium]
MIRLGIVKSLEDYENTNKILVNFPRDSVEVWCNITTRDAGKNYGSVVYPNVGSHVLTAFLDESFDSGFILCCVYNSSAAPNPLGLTPSNQYEITKTRSGTEVKIDNEAGNETITVKDKNDNSFSYSFESGVVKLGNQSGETSIEIDLKKNEITISSSKITLDVKTGKVVIQGGESSSFDFESASGKFNVDSADVKISAKNSFSAKAGSAAELSAAGTASISAEMIKIG